MGIKYGKFELPSGIKIDEASKTKTFGRFIAEPFERGFGHTVGNALRRIMLTGLESPAIISIRIEGVSHEYTAIESVIEDMTHIVLNLKSALLRYLPDGEKQTSQQAKTITKEVEITEDDLAKGGGQYVVTLGDLVGHSEFEVVNPDLRIFTATAPMKKQVAVRIGIGRAYVPSERHDILGKVVDEIIIDSAFSPVRLVNYHIENTRVGQDTDYDRLILEVTTDGRVTPEEAISFAAQIAMHHFDIFKEIENLLLSFDRGEIEKDTDKDLMMAKLALRINEIELSVRSTNCLSGADIETIAELVVMPETEMLKFRNFGKKSLTEIKSKLEEMNLSLGMDLSSYGITRENVREVIQEYQAAKAVGNES